MLCYLFVTVLFNASGNLLTHNRYECLANCNPNIMMVLVQDVDIPERQIVPKA